MVGELTSPLTSGLSSSIVFLVTKLQFSNVGLEVPACLFRDLLGKPELP